MKAVHLAARALGALILTLLATTARADVTVEVATGLGYTNSNLLLLGLMRPAAPVFGIESYTHYNVGAWDGRRAAQVIGVAKGLQWRFSNSEIRFSVGGSLISETSSRLGSVFEFYEQVLFQQRIARLDIALSYRHWSNANLKPPNLGVDFVGLQFEQKF